MSEPRLVTPLLEGYMMGDPISDHFGIRCCPALDQETEEKYIVKIISIPASQRQLEALLLSGAYGSAEEAREYFRSLANDAVEEAKTLQKLAKLEGFWGCEGWQMEPTADGTGFEVYLLSRYGTTLEHHLRRNCLTHLAAVNLGLDLCAALSVCRRNGWLYVDLKPENIIISDTRGYLIGDLGFLSLKSLRYASLPEKYRSIYTAPEIQDAYSTLNSTLDIYAAGRILSLVYNGGVLTEDPTDIPAYADPEMTQIIHKACAEDPAERWQDPEEMGQALATYLQSHTVNDTPIVPQPEPEIIEEPEEAVSEDPVEEIIEIEEELALEMEQTEEIPGESDPIVDEVISAPEEAPVSDEPAEESADGEPEQFVIDGFLFDEDLQDAEAVAQLSDDVISEEVSEMLAQADELIAHKAPDPVVAPEAIEVPMPEPILPEPEEPEAPAEPASEEEPESQEEALPQSEEAPEEADEFEDEMPLGRPGQRRRLGWLISLLSIVLVLLCAGLGGKYYYDNIYLQHITSVTASGEEDWLIVTLDTQIDNSLLTVTCTDSYGNRLTQPVENNRATFAKLPSATTFHIAVQIAKGHRLTGTTSATYTSDAQTTILDFKAVAGSTDGSVILNFSVQGPDSPNGWTVKYSADGEPELSADCNSHSAMISGLVVGKNYTFTLVPRDELYVIGGETTQFTAIAVILAQNLAIHGFENNALVADWTVPEGFQVGSWTVRCFNAEGYDTTFTVTEPGILIPGLDLSKSYTLEVKAEGMIEGKQVTISANSVTFKEMLIDNSDPAKLVVHWPYEGTAPAEGWTLRYTVDNSAPVTIPCAQNTCTIENPIPGGNYRFEVVLPEDVTHYGGTKEYQVAQAPSFSGYDVSAEDMQMQMCLRPDWENWDHWDVNDDAYTTAFTPGDLAGFVIYLNREYTTSPDEIQVTYILRAADGTFLQADYFVSTWTDLWLEGYCELDLPTLPAIPGEYTVEILFNNAYITLESIVFSVSEAPVTEPEE